MGINAHAGEILFTNKAFGLFKQKRRYTLTLRMSPDSNTMKNRIARITRVARGKPFPACNEVIARFTRKPNHYRSNNRPFILHNIRFITSDILLYYIAMRIAALPLINPKRRYRTTAVCQYVHDAIDVVGSGFAKMHRFLAFFVYNGEGAYLREKRQTCTYQIRS